MSEVLVRRVPYTPEWCFDRRLPQFLLTNPQDEGGITYIWYPEGYTLVSTNLDTLETTKLSTPFASMDHAAYALWRLEQLAAPTRQPYPFDLTQWSIDLTAMFKYNVTWLSPKGA